VKLRFHGEVVMVSMVKLSWLHSEFAVVVPRSCHDSTDSGFLALRKIRVQKYYNFRKSSRESLSFIFTD
jgi:hypothetical protein